MPGNDESAGFYCPQGHSFAKKLEYNHIVFSSHSYTYSQVPDTISQEW